MCKKKTCNKGYLSILIFTDRASEWMLNDYEIESKDDDRTERGSACETRDSSSRAVSERRPLSARREKKRDKAGLPTTPGLGGAVSS